MAKDVESGGTPDSGTVVSVEDYLASEGARTHGEGLDFDPLLDDGSSLFEGSSESEAATAIVVADDVYADFNIEDLELAASIANDAVDILITNPVEIPTDEIGSRELARRALRKLGIRDPFLSQDSADTESV